MEQGFGGPKDVLANRSGETRQCKSSLDQVQGVLSSIGDIGTWWMDQREELLNLMDMPSIQEAVPEISGFYYEFYYVN